MTGKFLAFVCLLGLHFWIHDVAGAHIDLRLPGAGCWCSKVSAAPVRKSLILKVEILSPRVYCPKEEAVITTKDMKLVCVDPDAKWFQNMILNLKQKKKQNETRAAQSKNTQE